MPAYAQTAAILPPSMLHAEIALADGRGWKFIGGTELPPYVDPAGRFSQRCIRPDVPADCPFTVYLRPDADGKRQEVVFELGRLSLPAAHSGPYTARIYQGDKVLATVNMKEHYWWGRWRWQSSPRPIKSAAEVLKSRLVLPYSKSFVRGQRGQPKALSYSPMGWPGYTDMGATGERDELGVVTSTIGDWLCGDGSPNNMMVWAESHGSVPVHYRVDGKKLSLVEHPRASSYWDPKAVGAKPWFQTVKSIRPEMAHYPACNYVPFLATGDPYLLEELHDGTTFQVINGNPGYRQLDKGLLREDQTRGYAWGLRDVAGAYLATPENTPPWMLPKSYWKRILDNNRDHFMERWVKNGAKNPLTGCHFAVDLTKDHMATWQQDFLGAVIGWMVFTGQFPDWRPIYEWHSRQAILRTNGKSGYPRSRAIFYYFKTTDVKDMASLARVNNITETPNGRFTDSDGKNAYAAYLRGNLKAAVLNGIPDAAESLAYVDSQVTIVPAKWAV